MGGRDPELRWGNPRTPHPVLAPDKKKILHTRSVYPICLCCLLFVFLSLSVLTTIIQSWVSYADWKDTSNKVLQYCLITIERTPGITCQVLLRGMTKVGYVYLV